jgi:hypothetical protein
LSRVCPASTQVGVVGSVSPGQARVKEGGIATFINFTEQWFGTQQKGAGQDLCAWSFFGTPYIARKGNVYC